MSLRLVRTSNVPRLEAFSVTPNDRQLATLALHSQHFLELFFRDENLVERISLEPGFNVTSKVRHFLTSTLRADRAWPFRLSEWL